MDLLAKNKTETLNKFANEDAKINLIFKIVDGLKDIIEEDREQKQPLFINISEQFLIKLVKNVISTPKKTYLLGITGESASGKTTLVDNATKALKRGCDDELYTTICCDDYYKDTSKELKEAGSYENLYMTGFSFDTPKAFNMDLMRAHLVSLKHGCGILAPEYNFVTCESIPNTTYKRPAQIILNEGLYVLNDDIIDLHDIKIYVFTPFNIIKDRWYKRAALRGKVGKAADMQFADVNATAQVYIRPAMEKADIVVNGLSSSDYIEYMTSKIVNVVKDTINFYMY